MIVTRKNFNRLHDALLKHFGAEEFVVLDLWCRIGIRCADGTVNMLTTSKSCLDSVSSNALFNLLLKHSIMTMKSNINFDALSAMYNISIDEVKIAAVRSILKCMRHGNVFVATNFGNGIEFMPTGSYAEFAVNFDLNN